MNRTQQAENYKKYLNNLSSESKPFMDYNLPKGNTKIKIVNSNVYILDTLNKHTQSSTVQAANKEEIKTVQNEIKEEIKELNTFKCYECIDFPKNGNSNNDICKKCSVNRQYELIRCKERLRLWENRLIKQEDIDD